MNSISLEASDACALDIPTCIGATPFCEAKASFLIGDERFVFLSDELTPIVPRCAAAQGQPPLSVHPQSAPVVE